VMRMASVGIQGTDHDANAAWRTGDIGSIKFIRRAWKGHP